MLEGIVYRFQPYPLAVARRRMVGAIARGIDRSIACPAVLVDHDAVVACQPRLARKRNGRNGADTDDDEVRGMAAVVGAYDPVVQVRRRSIPNGRQTLRAGGCVRRR